MFNEKKNIKVYTESLTELINRQRHIKVAFKFNYLLFELFLGWKGGCEQNLGIIRAFLLAKGRQPLLSLSSSSFSSALESVEMVVTKESCLFKAWTDVGDSD